MKEDHRYSDLSDQSDKRVIPPRDHPPTPAEIAHQLRLVNARQVVRINTLGNEIQAARRREARLRNMLDDAGVDLTGYDRGHDDGYRAGLREAQRKATTVGAGLLSEIIRLTHPDRHPPERYEPANRVTARLIAMRDELRAR